MDEKLVRDALSEGMLFGGPSKITVDRITNAIRKALEPLGGEVESNRQRIKGIEERDYERWRKLEKRVEEHEDGHWIKSLGFKEKE